MEDQRIIELYFARDESAVSETDRKYGKVCFHIAQGVLNQHEDSEECVNDTYMTVWRKIPPTRPDCFFAFLYKIARNLSLKKLEFRMAMKRTPDAVIPFAELEEVLPDNRFRPDVTEEELGKIISSFLKSEKEVPRNVFIRKYFYFDSISDIALRYSFTESNVKNMLHRTRNRLRIRLMKEGVEI